VHIRFLAPRIKKTKVTKEVAPQDKNSQAGVQTNLSSYGFLS